MKIVIIAQTTKAFIKGKANETVLIAPGEYKAHVWIDPNFEQEIVELLYLDGRMCEFEQESLLYRRAFDPETGKTFQSDAPVTVTSFLEKARAYFGDNRFHRLHFMSLI